MGIFDLGNLGFVPNPMGWIFPDLEKEKIESSEKFTENGIDALFLMNAGNAFLFGLTIFSIYGIARLIAKYRKQKDKIQKMASKLRYFFEWAVVERIWITIYLDLSISAFLQL